MSVDEEFDNVDRQRAYLDAVKVPFFAFCLPFAACGVEVTDVVSGGVESGVDSSYVYHGAVYNDEPVAWICPELDIALGERFLLDVWMWQLFDLTDRRREEVGPGEWTEIDYGFDISGDIWRSDDEKMALNAKVGYAWETYRSDEPTVDFLSCGLRFDNPYVTPYANGLLEVRQIHTMLLEAGLCKSVKLSDVFSCTALETLSADFSVAAYGGHKRGVGAVWLAEHGKTGVVSMSGKAGLTWRPCSIVEVGAYVSYFGIVSSRVERDIRSNDDLPPWYDHTQRVFGGLSACIEF